MKFEPLKELEFLSDRMKKFAESFPDSFSFEFGAGFEPKLDILEDDATVRIDLELPGIAREHCTLTLRNDTELELSGVKEIPAHAGGMSVMRSERAFGEFSRIIPLPARVLRDDIQASMRDGILTVILRKAGSAGGQKINVDIQ